MIKRKNYCILILSILFIHVKFSHHRIEKTVPATSGIQTICHPYCQSSQLDWILKFPRKNAATWLKKWGVRHHFTPR